MSETTRFKLNLRTGEVEIEGSEEFVERQIQNLEALVELIEPEVVNESDEAIEQESLQSENNGAGSNSDIPETFGEWLHSFKSDVNDLDKALITARYVQSQSETNDFKTSEVNKSLKEHGIKLSNPSTSLKRLIEKKYLFQTRKKGSLKFMRLSVDGQTYLDSIKAKG